MDHPWSRSLAVGIRAQLIRTDPVYVVESFKLKSDVLGLGTQFAFSARNVAASLKDRWPGVEVSIRPNLGSTPKERNERGSQTVSGKLQHSEDCNFSRMILFDAEPKSWQLFSLTMSQEHSCPSLKSSDIKS